MLCGLWVGTVPTGDLGFDVVLAGIRGSRHTCSTGVLALAHPSSSSAMQSTITALRSRVRSLGSSSADGKNIVAFSGGVDSSLVAALVHYVFPESSQACVGMSSALPTAQLDLARSVASHIG